CSRQGGRCKYVGSKWGREACRCIAVPPSPNLGAMESRHMETALESYRRIIAEQPTCDDRFFAQALARYRAGDESAAREISGSCLRIALQLAERHAADAAGPS